MERCRQALARATQASTSAHGDWDLRYWDAEPANRSVPPSRAVSLGESEGRDQEIPGGRSCCQEKWLNKAQDSSNLSPSHGKTALNLREEI